MGVDGLLHRKALARSDRAARQQRARVLLELQLRRLVQLRLRLSGKRHEPKANRAGYPLCALALHRRALRPRSVRADAHLRKPLFLTLQSVGCRSETGRGARRNGSTLRSLSERFVRCRAAVADEHRSGAGVVLSVEAELDRFLRRSSDPRLPGAAEPVAVRLSRAESESDAGAISADGADTTGADSRRIHSFVPVLGAVASLPGSGRQQLRAAGNDYDSQARLQNHTGVQLERAEVRDHVSQSAVLALLPAFCPQPAAGDRGGLLPAIQQVEQQLRSRQRRGPDSSSALPLSGDRPWK